MSYSYDRRVAARPEFLLPIKPTDSDRQIAHRMVLHAADGEIVRLSPRPSPKYSDYAFWYEEGELIFHAVNDGRPVSDLNGEQLALKVVKTWVKDSR